MKEMEAKTENRYEYRKPQEKRKQMIAPDLFEFAYVPDWYGHLAELERLALPESWKFRKPSRETKNTDTPILERYIHTIFRKQVIDFNSESDPRKADSIFHLENECVCFHTGLYTPQYKGIYGYFERNNVYVRQDPAGNIKMDKEKSTEKIDAAVATVMALDRAICNQGSEGSVYDGRGILVF